MIQTEITSTPHTKKQFYSSDWAMLFVASVLVYLPFTFNFLWGNHDWGWIMENTPMWSGVFEGRFSQFFLQVLLFGGNILPVLTLFSGLIFYTAAAILILKLWKIPQKHYIYLLLGINLVTSPYTISWLYFAFITLSCLSWPLFIFSGYWLLTHRPCKTAIPTAALLFMLALGGYPPVINLISVIFFTLLLNDICLNSLPLKTIFRKYICYIITICIAITLFLLIQYYLKKHGLQYNTYNTNSVSLNEFTAKIKILSTAVWEQFLVTTSFITFFYKYLWLSITLTAATILFTKTPKNTFTIFLFLCTLAGLLFSPLITSLATQNTIYVLYEPRIDFFSLIYIYIYAAAIIFRAAPQFIKNLTTLPLLFLTFYNIHTTAYAAKIWQLGFKAETNFAERFINRLESNQSFTPEKNYTFVQGGTLDFRSRYYLPENNSKIDSYTQTAPYIPWHLPSKAYKFYYPTDFFAADFDIFWSFVDANKLSLTPKLENYLRYNATPWPHSNAIFINNNTIILTLTPEGKQQAQTWINNL